MAICYKDMTFCLAEKRCENASGCWRSLSPSERAKADLWAISMGMLDEDNNPAPWIAWADFSQRCELYKEKK